MFGDALPMVSLDQDDAVLHGASRAAASSQLARERVEGVATRAQSVNHRHDLAVPAGAVSRDPDDAIVRKTRCGFR